MSAFNSLEHILKQNRTLICIIKTYVRKCQVDSLRSFKLTGNSAIPPFLPSRNSTHKDQNYHLHFKVCNFIPHSSLEKVFTCQSQEQNSKLKLTTRAIGRLQPSPKKPPFSLINYNSFPTKKEKKNFFLAVSYF